MVVSAAYSAGVYSVHYGPLAEVTPSEWLLLLLSLRELSWEESQ